MCCSYNVGRENEYEKKTFRTTRHFLLPEQLIRKKKNTLRNKIKRRELTSVCICGCVFIIFTNPSAQAGYDTRSFFMRSLTGLNSEFSFS